MCLLFAGFMVLAAPAAAEGPVPNETQIDADLLAAAQGALSRPAEAPTVTAAWLSARVAQDKGDWADATRFVDRLMAERPDDLAIARRGFLLNLGTGALDRAASLAPRLEPRDPDHLLAITLLGLRALDGGDAAAAERLFATSRGEGLGRFLRPLLIAWAQAAQDRPQEARASLAPLGREAGLGDLFAIHDGLLAERAGDLATAEERFAGLLDEPLSHRTAVLLGGFYERRGDAGKARALYTRYAEDSPSDPMPRLRLDGLGTAPPPSAPTPRAAIADALQEFTAALAREDEGADRALLFARLAVLADPAAPLPLLTLGDVLARRDQPEEAAAAYLRIGDDPTFGWLGRLRAAQAFMRAERDAEAEALLRQVADGGGAPATQALASLGDLYMSQDRFGDAVGQYDAAIAAVPTLEERHWGLLYARAIARERLGDWPAAEADLLRGLELAPEEPALLNHLGYIWADMGQNLPRARQLLEQAVALAPDDAAIIDSFGWALFRMGEHARAVVQLERAFNLRPSDSTIADHLGDAYWRVGRQREARFLWRRALDLGDDHSPAEVARLTDKIANGLAENDTSRSLDAADAAAGQSAPPAPPATTP